MADDRAGSSEAGQPAGRARMDGIEDDPAPDDADGDGDPETSGGDPGGGAVTVQEQPESAQTDASEDGADPAADTEDTRVTRPEPPESVPEDVKTYDRFTKVDRATYERVNDFLRDRTYITAREWAIARLCADFRTGTGVEMTKIGENLPYLVPFMTDTYSPQAVNQARSAFEEKVRMSGATFLYGAMSGFFSADELDDLMYEVTEVAKFLLEVEGVELAVEEELDTEDRISDVMREVRAASEGLRHEGVCCPECGTEFDVEE